LATDIWWKIRIEEDQEEKAVGLKSLGFGNRGRLKLEKRINSH
jgi:hypothetical protein